MIVENKHKEENLNLEESCAKKKNSMLAFLPLRPERDENVGFYSFLSIGTRMQIIVAID